MSLPLLLYCTNWVRPWPVHPHTYTRNNNWIYPKPENLFHLLSFQIITQHFSQLERRHRPRLLSSSYYSSSSSAAPLRTSMCKPNTYNTRALVAVLILPHNNPPTGLVPRHPRRHPLLFCWATKVLTNLQIVCVCIVVCAKGFIVE